MPGEAAPMVLPMSATSSDHELSPPCFLIEGAMTLVRAVELKQSLLDLLAREATVALDLSRVDEIDSSGVQLLLMARDDARRAGKSFGLSASSPKVAQTLQTLGLAIKDFLVGAVEPRP